jgi:outer membrane protein TolC
MQAMSDLANAQVEYSEANARWLRYRDVTAPKSEQVRESVEFAYKKGGATLVDLLNAEQTDNTIRLALAQAMSDTSSAIADEAAAQTVVPESELNERKK